MTIWIFDITGDPLEAFRATGEGSLPVKGPTSAGGVSRALEAVEKLRVEARLRGDSVLEMYNISGDAGDTVLRLIRPYWAEGVYVSGSSERITIVERKTLWRIIDARGLSLEDGKVVYSAS